MMKKIFLLNTLIISTAIFFSCSKSDGNSNTNSSKGKLIVNGVEHQLKKGFIIPNYTGTNEDYDKRRFYFVLTNDEISLQDNDFTFSNVITQAIDFNMYCSILNPGSVQSTTYNVKNSFTNVDYNEAFIDHSSIKTNIIMQSGSMISGNSLSSDDMTSGQVSISINNGIYTINFSFSNEDNIVSGNYVGTMTNLNYQYLE